MFRSMGTSSYQMHQTPALTFNSNFDRIYVLEGFHCKITRIK